MTKTKNPAAHNAIIIYNYYYYYITLFNTTAHQVTLQKHFLVQVLMIMFHSTGHAQHTKCKTTFDSVALRASKHGSVINTSQLLIILIFETGNVPPNYRIPLSPSALLRLKKLHTSPYYPVSTVFEQYYSVLQTPSLFNAEDRRYTVLLSRQQLIFFPYTPV